MVLEKIAKKNSLNRTGAVNVNKHEQKDMVMAFPHAAISSWITFLFYVYVPGYFVTAKKTDTEVGHVNKHIRDMLTGLGFGKCDVKAVAL